MLPLNAGPPLQPSFEEIAQYLPQMLFVADDGGSLVYCNPPWGAYTGQEAGTAPDFYRAVHEDDRDSVRRTWLWARAGNALLSLPLRLRADSGQYRWFQMQATSLRSGEGPWRWYGLFIDIDEQSRVRERLAEADHRNEVFLATLAHELRNPLAPIRNAAQVLVSPNQDAARQTWAAQIIDRQVTNLGLLLDDLLEASRITRGTLVLSKDNIVMRGVVDAAVELAHPALDRQGHEFRISGDALDESLHADPLRLTQVLGILLDNAAQYTPPQGHIELSVDRRGSQLELRVQDDGIGLAPDDQARVFEMFTQVRTDDAAIVPAGRSHSEGGLGIGLALAKGLVELHGGCVSVSSPGLGHGCVFRILLPLGEDASQQPVKQVPKPGRVAAAAGPLQVLVVDDNHDGADTLAALLTHVGHRVEVAYDGEEALRLARNHPPDVALIDLGMPQLDGCEVARRLRSEPWADGLYLIAATGWGQAEDRRRTQASGFDRHLVKPIDPLHIVQMLADRGMRRRPPPRSASQ